MKTAEPSRRLAVRVRSLLAQGVWLLGILPTGLSVDDSVLITRRAWFDSTVGNNTPATARVESGGTNGPTSWGQRNARAVD